MDETTPRITTHYTTLASPLPSSPSFTFHLTHLTSTLLIWVGSGPPSDPDLGEYVGIDEKRLAGDWAVAMPARGNIPVTATPVLRSGTADLALPMSQRLARRFPSNQIHLSLALPPSLTSSGGLSLDPFASKVLLLMEKRLGSWLDEILVTKD